MSRPKSKASARKRPSRVTLLAGGNPQIAKADGDAPVQAYIAAMPGWKRGMAQRLDTLVTQTLPRVGKAVKWNSALYGIGDQGWLLSMHAYTNYLKVAFHRGASLEPPPPMPSKDANTRYLHVSQEGFDEKQFVRWVKQAAKLPGWKSGLVPAPPTSK